MKKLIKQWQTGELDHSTFYRMNARDIFCVNLVFGQPIQELLTESFVFWVVENFAVARTDVLQRFVLRSSLWQAAFLPWTVAVSEVLYSVLRRMEASDEYEGRVWHVFLHLGSKKKKKKLFTSCLVSNTVSTSCPTKSSVDCGPDSSRWPIFSHLVSCNCLIQCHIVSSSLLASYLFPEMGRGERRLARLTQDQMRLDEKGWDDKTHVKRAKRDERQQSEGREVKRIWKKMHRHETS